MSDQVGEPLAVSPAGNRLDWEWYEWLYRSREPNVWNAPACSPATACTASMPGVWCNAARRLPD
jgi:hypothetical protein